MGRHALPQRPQHIGVVARVASGVAAVLLLAIAALSLESLLRERFGNGMDDASRRSNSHRATASRGSATSADTDAASVADDDMNSALVLSAVAVTAVVHAVSQLARAGGTRVWTWWHVYDDYWRCVAVPLSLTVPFALARMFRVVHPFFLLSLPTIAYSVAALVVVSVVGVRRVPGTYKAYPADVVVSFVALFLAYLLFATQRWTPLLIGSGLFMAAVVLHSPTLLSFGRTAWLGAVLLTQLQTRLLSVVSTLS